MLKEIQHTKTNENNGKLLEIWKKSFDFFFVGFKFEDKKL